MAKVTIIGCGVVGAAIAYELSRQPGLEVTLVDQQPPAQGSTGAALGVLMGIVSHKLKGRAWQLRQTSLLRYETLVPELEAITGQKIPYNRHGLVLLATAAHQIEQWRTLAVAREAQGWELDIWEPATLKEYCPQVNIEGLWGAMYSPSDRQIDPVALTQALVKAAKKNGVKGRFDLKITNLQQQLAQENLEADWIILATALGTKELTATISQREGYANETPVDIRPVLGQAIELELPEILGNPDFQPVITGNDIHIVPITSIMPSANHGSDYEAYHYWVGATVEFADAQGQIQAQGELLEKVKQGAIAFCPELALGSIVKTWSGLRPRPEAQPAPIIQKLPGQEKIILATGHYRNGVLLAPATAIAVRDLLGNL